MVVQESENYTLRKSLAKTFDKKTIIMIVLAIALLYKIVTDLEITLNEMIEYAFQANTNLVLVGIFFAFFALAMDSLTWWVLLKASDIQASYLKSFRVFMSTWAYQLLIPGAGVAELVVRSSVGASSFEKNDGGQVSVGDILPSIMLHRLLGLLAAIPLMVYIAYALTEFLNVPSDTANLLLLFMTIFSLGVLILFMLIAGLPNQVSYVFQKIIAIPSMFFDSLTEKTKNWQVSIDEAIWEYCDGFKQLWKVKWAAVVGFVGVMIAAVSHWVSIAFIYWGMHIQIDFVNVAVISFVGGTLSFWLIQESAMDDQFSSKDIIIEGANGSELYYEFDAYPSTTWTHYEIPLDPNDVWFNSNGDAASTLEFENVMNDLQKLWIRGEYQSGEDTGGLDKFQMKIE